MINPPSGEWHSKFCFLQRSNNDDYLFEIGFLETGSYTASFTCKADLDNPSRDDDIEFIASESTTIAASQQTDVVFQNSTLGTTP